MNFNQLEWFCRAFEERSFAEAASESFVSRQAFSKAIGKLEGELGVKLFVRGQGGVQPTAVANELYPVVKRCTSDMAEIRAICDDCLLGAKQLVRVALANGVVESVPASFFDLLEEQVPRADIRFEKHHFSRCKDLLDAGLVSFAVCPGPEALDGYESILLSQEKLYLVGRKGVAPFSSGHCSLESLEGAEYFSVGEGWAGSLGLEELLESRNIHAVRNNRYTEYGIVLEKAQSGKGFALVPEDALGRIKDPNAVLAPFPGGLLKWEVYLYFRPHGLSSTEEQVVKLSKGCSPAA